jgi:hypothetical protein
LRNGEYFDITWGLKPYPGIKFKEKIVTILDTLIKFGVYFSSLSRQLKKKSPLLTSIQQVLEVDNLASQPS